MVLSHYVESIILKLLGTKQVIVFTEVPYMVNIEEGVVGPIKKLVIEDGFDLELMTLKTIQIKMVLV